MMIIFDLVIALLLGSTFGVITMCIFMINGRCEERIYDYVNEEINKEI